MTTPTIEDLSTFLSCTLVYNMSALNTLLVLISCEIQPTTSLY